MLFKPLFTHCSVHFSFSQFQTSIRTGKLLVAFSQHDEHNYFFILFEKPCKDPTVVTAIHWQKEMSSPLCRGIFSNENILLSPLSVFLQNFFSLPLSLTFLFLEAYSLHTTAIKLSNSILRVCTGNLSKKRNKKFSLFFFYMIFHSFSSLTLYFFFFVSLLFSIECLLL